MNEKPMWSLVPGQYTDLWYVVREGKVVFSSDDQLVAQRWMELAMTEAGE